MLCFLIVFCLAIFQLSEFASLYEKIKNDKYLVGKRLVNYNHNTVGTTSEETPGPAVDDPEPEAPVPAAEVPVL